MSNELEWTRKGLKPEEVLARLQSQSEKLDDQAFMPKESLAYRMRSFLSRLFKGEDYEKKFVEQPSSNIMNATFDEPIQHDIPLAYAIGYGAAGAIIYKTVALYPYSNLSSLTETDAGLLVTVGIMAGIGYWMGRNSNSVNQSS